MARVMVLDASVLIAFLDLHDAHHPLAEALLLSAVDEDLGASALTLAEVLVGPARRGRADAAVTALSDLAVAEIPLPSDAAVRLARLRATTGLRMPDCCVLLTAQDEQARLATYDARLATVARGLRLDVVP